MSVETLKATNVQMPNEGVWNHDMEQQSVGVIAKTEFAHLVASGPIMGLVYVRTRNVLMK